MFKLNQKMTLWILKDSSLNTAFKNLFLNKNLETKKIQAVCSYQYLCEEIIFLVVSLHYLFVF